ncbi:hypothetical protein ACF1HU_35825 [Streptomyces olivaceus]|uniref:hypothetical protein n=1 Tax=Streptomyces olivaceus TaxID=47716 RepID=UPI0036FE1DE5
MATPLPPPMRPRRAGFDGTKVPRDAGRAKLTIRPSSGRWRGNRCPDREVSMTKHNAEKKAARELQRAEGISYQKALNRVRAEGAGAPAAVAGAVPFPAAVRAVLDRGQDAPYLAVGEPTAGPYGWHFTVIRVVDRATVLTFDMPKWGEWRPASAGHRLIERGYITSPPAHFEPDRAAGWESLPDGGWAAPVHPVEDIVGKPIPSAGEEAAASRSLRSYGPRQFADRIELSEWQFLRALRLNLIPPADQGGRWSEDVFNDVIARMDAVREEVGTVPDVGAVRAEEHLSERFGFTVACGTAAELARRGHLPVRGDYKGHPLYCGLTLERFTDRRKVQRASAAGELHTREEAARVMGLRDSDFDHLLRGGLLTHSQTTTSSRSKHIVVRLYRQADLDRVLRSRRIDWTAVRSTPKGRPSPLAQLPTRTP